MTDKIKILLCTHKPWDLPKDIIYLPVQAGKTISDIDLGIAGDNTGDNISEKNKSFCELTVLYWAWKNIKKIYPYLDYIGLCHYRRFFVFNSKKLEQDLVRHQIILPRKSVYPYSLAVQYCIGHIKSDYNILRNIIAENSPVYSSSFEKIMSNTNKISLCNMFISKFSLFDEYCSWVFPILFEAEKRVNLNLHDSYQTRVFGFMAERLLNIFVFHHNLSIKYYPVQYIDGTRNSIINESHKDIFRQDLIFSVTKCINRIFRKKGSDL